MKDLGNFRLFEYSDLEAFLELAKDFIKKNDIKGIYPMPRGGLVPATYLSYRMSIPLYSSAIPGSLVIEDDTYTGDSLLHFKRVNIPVATMNTFSESRIVPDVTLYKFDDWKPIYYPWNDPEIADIEFLKSCISKDVGIEENVKIALDSGFILCPTTPTIDALRERIVKILQKG